MSPSSGFQVNVRLLSHRCNPNRPPLAYVSSIHLSTNEAALSLAMLNAASLVGRLGFGMLSDIINPWTLASATLLLTSLSVFVLWGVLSFNLAGVMVYGIAYGCLTGGWTSLWAGFLRPIASELRTCHMSCIVSHKCHHRRRSSFDDHTIGILFTLSRYWQHFIHAHFNCIAFKRHLRACVDSSDVGRWRLQRPIRGRHPIRRNVLRSRSYSRRLRLVHEQHSCS